MLQCCDGEGSFQRCQLSLGHGTRKACQRIDHGLILHQCTSPAESPEATDGRYGYYCAQNISGTSTEVDLTIYLRDFDLDILNRRIEALKSLAVATEALYPNGKVSVDAKHIYYNMALVAAAKPFAMENLYEAGRQLGMELQSALIRGGTDGARMANERNIPCPNIFTGDTTCTPV
jgi:tripeptide aminopeptidase